MRFCEICELNFSLFLTLINIQHPYPIFRLCKIRRWDSFVMYFFDKITPNQHSILLSYLLMDNCHFSGKYSAEGHHWECVRMVSDYTEKRGRA
jgi:hypothetical protein